MLLGRQQHVGLGALVAISSQVNVRSYTCSAVGKVQSTYLYVQGRSFLVI